jgi:hypothetical protein
MNLSGFKKFKEERLIKLKDEYKYKSILELYVIIYEEWERLDEFEKFTYLSFVKKSFGESNNS